MPEEMNPQSLWDTYGPWVVSGALKVLGALLVIIIGLRIAGWLGNLVRSQSMKREDIDDTLGNFFGSLVRWAVTAAVLITALSVFGVQATSFVAILGALTLAIGLSMQGALGNIASGVMIMLFRPYKLGDWVEVSGVAGTVKDINLFQTVLTTVDNVKMMVPNGQAIDGVISNYSAYDTRRVDITFGIDYDDNMDAAIAAIRQVIEADNRVFTDPEPFVKVTNLGDSSVDIATRSWVNAADYWDVKFDLTKKVKEALDGAGVSIPYPHTTMVQKSAH
ncbi:MAG: mechanosensitive ion channel [Alphaproteobacteria bacterium]|jgi:small conductance mechanosensitive channel|nr:mechanosensitive ion channel [Alphaproteobacteria bacterium]